MVTFALFYLLVTLALFYLLVTLALFTHLGLPASRCQTGSRIDDKGTGHPGQEGKCLKAMKMMIPVRMMILARMRKLHSVEKTRVSLKLVSVSPPPPPLRSALSQHDRQIIAVPTSRRATHSRHLSKQASNARVMRCP